MSDEHADPRAGVCRRRRRVDVCGAVIRRAAFVDIFTLVASNLELPDAAVARDGGRHCARDAVTVVVFAGGR